MNRKAKLGSRIGQSHAKQHSKRNRLGTRIENLEDRRMLSCSPVNTGTSIVSSPTLAAALGVNKVTSSLKTATPAAQAATTTAVTVSNATPSFSQPVTLTATITTASGSPTGIVQFLDGASVIGTARVNHGVATLTINNLTVNASGQSHSITAQYLGDTGFAGSTSTTPVTVTVSQASTITLLTAKPNPVAPGATTTLIAAVIPNFGNTQGGLANLINTCRGGFGGLHLSPITPTGQVEFDATDGTGNVTVLGTGTLNNGVATFSTNSLPTGDVTITAVYKGDANFKTSSSQSITESVSSTQSAARIRATVAKPVTVNTAAAFSVTVGGKGSASTTIPTGTVSFFDLTTGTSLTGATPVALTAGTANATASFSSTFTTTGVHLIQATYSGDANYASSQVLIPVNVKAATTTTTPNTNSLASLIGSLLGGLGLHR